MESGYSIKVCKDLEKDFRATKLSRPMRIDRYEAGTELHYEITGIDVPNKIKVRLSVEKFVGGGFAGQVYQVKILETTGGIIKGIEPGKIYAMKILIPPSTFSKFFRNFLYWVGFQGPFQLQVNPAASRSGAIWQKFIRRAAKIQFGDERAVVNIYATFIDDRLGSCGELSEWLEGRTWRLETDEYLDVLKKWRKGKKVDSNKLGSLEYRSKYEFMVNFVELLHKVGAHEFARQYEWTTCKSQPNCLKRKDTENNPEKGLAAVDFRAGLALLPFLPMSPGDFKLIFQGLMRGSLIQFDRGDVKKLEQYISDNKDEFADLIPMLDELKSTEDEYRNSIPDVTHNHFRLFFSGKLWKTIFKNTVTGWKVRNLIDSKWEMKFRNNKLFTVLFTLIGIIPFLGNFIRKIWAQKNWRKHYFSIFSSRQYFKRAVRGKFIEKIISWHRAGRIDEDRAEILKNQQWKCVVHLPLSVLPVGLHKLFTDWQYAKNRLDFLLLRPIRLYFNEELRTQWLRDMVSEGEKKHLLTEEDSKVIISQIDEPFIQKYLKSLAVHLCTIPITQVVSILVAIIYIVTHPELPRSQAYGIGLGIIALFQVVPISPGSLIRGLYVLFLVIRERNFKDYNIAVFLAFFKYIGYLAFPIQMAYRYPALARFMAGHWATEAVHIVPVFGERGALLEHWVFSLFYNWPLTIRRRIKNRSEYRTAYQPRYWHISIWAIVAAGLFGLADMVYFKQVGSLPQLKNIWWLVLMLPLLSGALVTIGAGGAVLSKRVIGGAICGTATAILYTVFTASFGETLPISEIVTSGSWRVFIFTFLSTIGVLLTEMKLPDPQLA